MSAKENIDLNEINDKLNRIYLIIEGEPKQGVEGLVPMLQRHMDESKKNLKQLSADIHLAYSNDIKRIDNTLLPLKKELDDHQKYRYKHLGIFGGVMFVVGNFIHFLWEIFKTK